MSRVVVIGAGWLGLPLAKNFKASGHEVVVSKRKPEDCQHLREVEKLEAVPWQLGESLPEALRHGDIYIINIAPGRRTMVKEQFVADMQVLFSECLAGTACVLFVSSTSVYGERQRTIIETSETEPLTESALAHATLENWLQENAKPSSTILRLAGLIGEDRNPVHSFAGKKNITAASKMVNFVHRDDAIAAIIAVTKKRYWGHVLHLCATDHPSRMAYYKWAAGALYLSEPQFMDESEQKPSGKVVDASNTIQVLGLEMKYASPYQMIPGVSPPERTAVADTADAEILPDSENQTEEE